MAKLSAALIILLAVLFGGNAVSQELPPQQPNAQRYILLQSPCNKYEEMERLAKKHGEELLFMGEGLTFSSTTGRPYRGGMAFFVDQENGNWTMFQLFADGIACMLFNGTNFQPYSGD